MNKPRVLSNVVKGISDPIFGKKSMLYSQLITNWAKIVGQNISGYTLPLALKFRKQKDQKHNSAVLKMGVTSAHAQNALMQKAILIEKINQFMGFQAVLDIEIQHMSQNLIDKRPINRSNTPLKKPLSTDQTQAINSTIENIEDDALKTALERFGRAIYSRQSD